jgi:tripartite-type tricarboxylate transporter receptor subunit TctC
MVRRRVIRRLNCGKLACDKNLENGNGDARHRTAERRHGRMQKFLSLLMVCAIIALAAPAAQAAPYPDRPVKILVAFPPGGGLDFTTRLIAQYLQEGLGQQVIVDNRPGAAGVLAHADLARAAPDGYTLIVANIGPLALAPLMMSNPPYDPLRDFTPIGQVVATSFIAVVPASSPANSLREFFDWAKKNEGKVNCASGGSGSITHMNCVLLNQAGGIHAEHVPYKGTAPAMADLMAGQTQILMDIVSVLGPQVKGGRLKALAVTGAARDPDFPNVPTMREAGYPQLDTSGWQGLIGPAGMPHEVVARLSAELKKVLARPDVRERLAKAGTPVVERGPDEFAAFIKSEIERWRPIIKASGARID